jgi:hypothetical protein
MDDHRHRPHHHHHHHHPPHPKPDPPRPDPPYHHHPPHPRPHEAEALRLEYVTTSVGFDDMLDVSLAANHPHFDTAIIVTSHDDERTQKVAAKHGAICVLSDLFSKNGRVFNKGAAINDGFSRWQYHGWRAHMDADIIVPDNFRRILFNHTVLDQSCIYGADRIDVVGREPLARIGREPQHIYSFLMTPQHRHVISSRYVDTLRGYVPIGYFQLWHAGKQPREYPYSLGNAAHDDVMFAHQWPRERRRLLPTMVLWHLIPEPQNGMGLNWEGRRQPRLK